MSNLPSYDTTRFSCGPGVLYMGIPGTTPTIEVGAVKGDATFSVNRTFLKVEGGSPKSLLAQYATKEEVSLKVTGIEWKLDNLAYAIGAGVTAMAGADEKMEFGGDMAVNNRALRYVHIAPDGSTIDIHIFKAQGAGKIDVSFKEDSVHEFPFEFNALVGTSDFTNAALSDKKKMFKIIRTKV